jgi:hypothetical protein
MNLYLEKTVTTTPCSILDGPTAGEDVPATPWQEFEPPDESPLVKTKDLPEDADSCGIARRKDKEALQ